MTPNELKDFLKTNNLTHIAFVKIVWRSNPERWNSGRVMVSQWVTGKNPVPAWLDHIIENWEKTGEKMIEYKVLEVDGLISEDKVNELGSGGWIIQTIIVKEGMCCFYLMRHKMGS